jgi:hypothetical protein
MPLPDLTPLSIVADRLDQLRLSYAFTGGVVVNLLLDDSEFTPARPTLDVDVILEVLTAHEYSKLEAELRDLGFDHDMTQGAPRCRWKLDGITVDIMPTKGQYLGLIPGGLPRL